MQIRPSYGPSSRLRWSGAWLLFSAISIPCALAQQQIPEQAGRILFGWAEASGLTAEWQFPQELRRDTHPSGAGQAWTLDLRFLHRPTDHGDHEENQRLAEFLERYQGDQGVSFSDKIFYKVLQIADLRRADAAVNLNVGANTIAVFVDPATGELVSKVRGQRFETERAVVRVPSIPAQARSLMAAVPDPAADGDWPRKVRAFLEGYFQAENRKAGLPAPRIVPDCQDNHVGLTVYGLRNQVFPNGMYWEKIQVAADVWHVPGGIQLSAVFDAAFASGIRGSGLPSVYPEFADTKYNKELKEFSSTLFDKLKTAMAKGAI